MQGLKDLDIEHFESNDSNGGFGYLAELRALTRLRLKGPPRRIQPPANSQVEPQDPTHQPSHLQG